MNKLAIKTLAAKADDLNSFQLDAALGMVRLCLPGFSYWSWAASCAENDCDAEIFETVFGELEPENSPDSNLEIQFRKEAQHWMR